MTITTLTDQAEAERLIALPAAWIFKHSRTCGVSAEAMREVEAYLAAHALPFGLVVVQDQRPLSNWLSTRLGYTHQSPQLFLVGGGAVRWQASHWSITAAAMAAAQTR